MAFQARGFTDYFREANIEADGIVYPEIIQLEPEHIKQ
jgi:hypothetical protein